MVLNWFFPCCCHGTFRRLFLYLYHASFSWKYLHLRYFRDTLIQINFIYLFIYIFVPLSSWGLKLREAFFFPEAFFVVFLKILLASHQQVIHNILWKWRENFVMCGRHRGLIWSIMVSIWKKWLNGLPAYHYNSVRCFLRYSHQVPLPSSASRSDCPPFPIPQLVCILNVLTSSQCEILLLKKIIILAIVTHSSPIWAYRFD